jgi:hypothetical protein
VGNGSSSDPVPGRWRGAGSDCTQCQRPAAADGLRGHFCRCRHTQLEIVAGTGLFAVIDEAEYSLKHITSDEFEAGSGDRVLFTRDASGRVTGYSVKGVARLRLSSTVNKASADLAWPRPRSAPG